LGRGKKSTKAVEKKSDYSNSNPPFTHEFERNEKEIVIHV